jgi:WD40 repeat protein
MRDAKDGVTGVAFLPHSPHLLTSVSVDGAWRVYDARMGQLLTQRCPSPLTSITPMQEGGAVLLSTLDSRLLLLSSPLPPPPSPSSSLLQSFVSPSYVQRVYSVRPTLMAGSTYVVSGTEANAGLVRWEVDTGREVDRWGEDGERGAAGDGAQQQGKSALTTCVGWSEEQQLLIGGSTDGRVRVWQMGGPPPYNR